MTAEPCTCIAGDGSFVCPREAECEQNALEARGVIPSFEFTLDDDGTIPAESAVFQALGAASMCWTETPVGVFESERAKLIGDALLERLKAELGDVARNRLLRLVAMHGGRWDGTTSSAWREAIQAILDGDDFQ